MLAAHPRGLLDARSRRPLVAEKTAWYVARPDYLKRVFERSRRYLYHIVDEIEKRGLPTELALLPMVESSFNPMAYSRAHASGLWQFIPGTGKRYDLAQNMWYDGRRDIVASPRALDYLKDVYANMHGGGTWRSPPTLGQERGGAGRSEDRREEGKRHRASTCPQDRYYVPKLQAREHHRLEVAVRKRMSPDQPYFATRCEARHRRRLAAKLPKCRSKNSSALFPTSAAR